MKAFKSISTFTLSISLLAIAAVFSTVRAQEYDDMYFTKSDRETVKGEVASALDISRKELSEEAKNLTKSTEQFSSKNINPEYIARYKSNESNEAQEPVGQDYFIENYDEEYVSDPDLNQIDYAALNKRDQMSYSNYNRPYSSPSWNRFSPYMSMGMMYGYPYYGGYGYSPFGYDPFMMGSGMSMGIGFGTGFGYGPTMSYNIGMSWGSGYNPWGGWGGYPGYYNPYGMGGYYDPWGPSFGYNPYSFRNPWYRNSYYYGGYYPTVMAISNSGGSEYINGRNIQYTSRSSRSAATSQYGRTRTTRTSEGVRVASSDANIRVPSRATTSANSANGRVSRDYSRSQNDYYNPARRNSASRARLGNNDANRSTFSSRGVNSSSRYNTPSVNRNKPSRANYSNSNTNSGSTSFTGNRGTSSRSSSYSSPNRSSSSSSFSGRSYSSGSSSRSSSYSSGGGSRSSSSGTRSSSGSSSRRQ